VPRDVAEDYFYRGVWDGKGDEARLRSYTCVACGWRTVAWPSFLEHRKMCGKRGFAAKLGEDFDARVYDSAEGDEENGGDVRLRAS
jgi:hypothetical protein